MLTVEPRVGESRPGLAIAGGVLAGLLTLAVVALVVRATGGDESTEAAGRPAPGQAVSPATLTAGDCIEPGTSPTAGVILRTCDAPHRAEVTGQIPVTGVGDAYPGAERLGLSVGQQCERQADDHLGTPLLSTALVSDHLAPTLDDWTVGDRTITCYVARLDGADLTFRVEDRGTDLPRPDQVAVSRLMVGDCFVPADDLASYDLNSNSPVDLVPCAGTYNGTFFGRGLLEAPTAGAPFPGDTEISQITSERCASLFQDTYGVPADGFNYRYWRPNQQSWNLGDRSVLCAILDAEPLTGLFEPARYRPFFELPIGECFDLGPEETDRSLGLDDRVRVVDCNLGHAGQMIGSGVLETAEDDGAYPGEEEVERLAGSQCEQLFESFVGISPFESELVNFPFWYPNESGWADGDRRYACAFLDDIARVGSLEGSGR